MNSTTAAAHDSGSTPQLELARAIIDNLYAQGVRQVLLCPGNQSSPLAAALSEQQRIACTTHFDERGAGFMALGYAKASQRPAAVICTSGTAVANLYPAVLEAAQAQVPLLAITADRPEELQAAGANQTFRQTDFFADFVRWRYEFSAPTCFADAQTLANIRTAIAYAVHAAQGAVAGPVHLNVRFRKPFLSAHDKSPQEALHESSSQGGVQTYYTPCQLSVPESALRRIARTIMQAKRGVISVGELSTDANRHEILKLADKLQWPVWGSVLSGLRSPDYRGLSLAHWYLSDADFAQSVCPDVVLHFGAEAPKPGNAAQTFFETPSVARVYVSEQAGRVDPRHSVSERVNAEPCWFASKLSAVVDARPSELIEPLAKAEAIAQEVLAERAEDEQLSELAVVRSVYRACTAEQQMYLGNSLPIRLADYAACAGGAAMLCNRGLSGIDGSIATAFGALLATEKQTIALIGDLTALHDVNSLAMVQSSKLPLILIVLNNRGGGIFRQLPEASRNERFERYMQTPHHFDFRDISRWAGMQYYLPERHSEFEEQFQEAVSQGKAALIEVQVPGDASTLMLQHYTKMIHAQLRELMK